MLNFRFSVTKAEGIGGMAGAVQAQGVSSHPQADRQNVHGALRRLELTVNLMPCRSRKLRAGLAAELRRIASSLSEGRDD